MWDRKCFPYRNMRKDYNPDWWKIMSEDLLIKQNRTESGITSKKTLVSDI